MTAAARRRRIVQPGSEPLSGARRRRALYEIAKRRQAARAVSIDDRTFRAQRAFIADTSRLVAACCSRRAGKTWGIAYKMVDVASKNAWSTTAYITNTRGQAKRNVWPVLLRLNVELGLGAKPNGQELTFTLPNGAIILLGGANDEYEIERYRGPAYHLVVVDEAQSIRGFFRVLIDEILEPATMDHRGQIMLTGTPNASGLGYFRDVMHGAESGWSLHRWTVLDNETMPHAAEELENIKRRRGWTDQTPKFRREYLGEWVRDTASQVYQIADKNLVPAFPRERADDWEYVLGIDLGFVGVSAFVVMAYSVSAGVAVVVESHQLTPERFGAAMLAPEHLGAEIARLEERYMLRAIVIDPGGLGAKFVDEMRRRFGARAEAAEKAAKLAAIELLNGDLQAGRVLVVEPTNADLLHDARMLEWKWDKLEDHSGPVDRADLVIDGRTPDHLTDALTYAYRRCRAYLHVREEPRARLTEAEREEREERERERIELEGDDERPWWAQGPEVGSWT